MSTSFKALKIDEIDFFGSSNLRSSNERRKKIDGFTLDPSKRENFQKYGFNYFDDVDYGVGYGGYSYDGRYADCAKKIIAHYGLSPGDSVLEIGCAKGFLICEFYKNGINIAGIDLSRYAIKNAVKDVKSFMVQGSCEHLPWKTDSFDLVISKDTLPHLTQDQLISAIGEIRRVCRTDNIFFEIGVIENQQGRELMKAWDETQQSIENSVWWRHLLSNCGFRGQVNFKSQF